MTIAELQAALVAKVIAQTGASVELAHALARTDALAAGVTACAALGVVAGFDRRSDSNLAYAVAQIRLWMVHRLADPLDEAAYLEGAMQTDQALVMDRRFWAIAEAYDVLDELEMQIRPQRIGNVIEYAIDGQLRYVPS